MSIVHCECNYIPGILKYAEMADIAGLIAPRPLLIESGTEDPIFPVKAATAAYRSSSAFTSYWASRKGWTGTSFLVNIGSADVKPSTG